MRWTSRAFNPHYRLHRSAIEFEDETVKSQNFERDAIGANRSGRNSDGLLT